MKIRKIIAVVLALGLLLPYGGIADEGETSTVQEEVKPPVEETKKEPAQEETPKKEETPKQEEEPKQEEAPKVEEIPVQENAGDKEEKNEEASEGGQEDGQPTESEVEQSAEEGNGQQIGTPSEDENEKTPEGEGADPLTEGEEPSEDEEMPVEKVISVIQRPETTEYSLRLKPAYEEVLAALPGTLTVEYESGETEALAVVWSCEGYENGYDGTYEFVSAFTDVETELAMPTVQITVSYAIEDERYEGTLNEDGTIRITAYTGSEKDVTVPDEFDGFTVADIAARAFAGNAAVESVTLPKKLKTLGGETFDGCGALRNVTVGSLLEEAGSEPFKGCDALEKLILCVESGSEAEIDAEDGWTHEVQKEETKVKCEVRLGESLTGFVIRGKAVLSTDRMIDKENALTVENGASVTNQGVLTNLGSISIQGTLENAGTILSCGGIISGTVSGSAASTAHSYTDGKCTVCGAAEPAKTLKITYSGEKPTKVYDGNTEITLKASDFVLSDTSVTIVSVTAVFDKADAGERTVTAHFKLNNAKDYTTVPTVTVAAAITPKTLTITPTEGQSKIFGKSDPSFLNAKVKGLISGDLLSGRLSREAGEKVGRYRITQGTLVGGSNYRIEIAEGYFEIKAKSIAEADVSVTRIPNQAYTGQEIKPEVTARYGSATLKEGSDYTLAYSDNIEAGLAKATLTGKGDYIGTREISFRILKVSGGTSYTGGSTISGSSGYRGSSGTSGSGWSGFGFDEIEEEGETSLVVKGEDYGTILFNELGEACTMITDVEELPEAEGRWRLHVEPAEEPEEELERPHMVLERATVERLWEAGCEEIWYEFNELTLTISLNELKEAQIVFDPEKEQPEWVVKPERWTALIDREEERTHVSLTAAATFAEEGMESETVTVDALSQLQLATLGMPEPFGEPEQPDRILIARRVLEQNEEAEEGETLLCAFLAPCTIRPEKSGMYEMVYVTVDELDQMQ